MGRGNLGMAVSARSGHRSLSAAWHRGPSLCPPPRTVLLARVLWGLAKLGAIGGAAGLCFCKQTLKFGADACGKVFCTAGSGARDSGQSCCCIHGCADGWR